MAIDWEGLLASLRAEFTLRGQTEPCLEGFSAEDDIQFVLMRMQAVKTGAQWSDTETSREIAQDKDIAQQLSSHESALQCARALYLTRRASHRRQAARHAEKLTPENFPPADVADQLAQLEQAQERKLFIDALRADRAKDLKALLFIDAIVADTLDAIEFEGRDLGLVRRRVCLAAERILKKHRGGSPTSNRKRK